MSGVICGAPSLWRGVVCTNAPHAADRHDAEDDRSIYTWTTAAVEAEADGRCPGCLRWVCACPCNCDTCAVRKAGRR